MASRGSCALLVGYTSTLRTNHFTQPFLGLVIPPVFSKKATHLLCPSGTGLKFDKAQEWGIPVVSVGWLAAMATSGVVPDVKPYLVGGSGGVSPPPPLPAEESMKSHANLPSIKGKGKARATDTEDGMEIDNQMHDITNSEVLLFYFAFYYI